MNLSPQAAKQRGLDSEAQVEKTLQKMEGESLNDNPKVPKLSRRILGFFRSTQNDETDSDHTDFVVRVESDLRVGVIEVHVQVKSSERAKRRFTRLCRLKNWGFIPCVVAKETDTTHTLRHKVREALITGYNFLRRKLSEMFWPTKKKKMRRRLWKDQGDVFWEGRRFNRHMARMAH